MKRFMTGTLVVVMLAAGGLAARESHTESREDEPKQEDIRKKDGQGGLELQALATLAPQCFTSGSGVTFLKICITERGNISHLESPAGEVHLTGREGYLLCESSGPVGFDAGVAESGWEAPSVSQPNGAGTLPLIVTRDSLDGRIRLKQTFTRNIAERGVDVKIDLKNISPVQLVSVQLFRYFDADVARSGADDEWRNSLNSAWARTPQQLARRPEVLLLTIDSNTTVATAGSVDPFADWNPLGSGRQTARTCTLGLSAFTGDGVGRIFAGLGIIQPGETKSVTFRYRRL